MKVIGVNGMSEIVHLLLGRPADGSETTDRMLYKLEQEHGFETLDFNFSPVHVFQTRDYELLHLIAGDLASETEPGDVLVAHSLGCLIGLMAMEYGAKFSQVFFFSGAVNYKRPIPATGCETLYNFHTRMDLALLGGSMLLAHPFGSMGRVGHQGGDPRVVNLHFWQWPPSHNHWFKSKHLEFYTDLVADRLRDDDKHHTPTPELL